METQTPSEPAPQKIDSPAKGDFPELPEDGRVKFSQANDTLVISVIRSSIFWQPTTLIAVWLILFPLAVVLTIWVVVLAAGGPDLARRFLSWEPPLPWIIVGAVIPWLALGAAILAGTKTVEFIADRDRFRMQTRWLFLKKSRSWSVADLRDFSYDEYFAPSKSGGGVLWRKVYLMPRKGHAELVFETARLPFEHMNFIAAALRHYYGR
ncbi:MAG TPA: hypothetical protein VKJ65_01620 [Phycisphaerae bacterium]|nr:hypothetical protein [Phycisphaerae bacterium]